MIEGYLVTLGNTQLNSGDTIGGGLVRFASDNVVGTGSWTWSGTYTGNGQTYSNITDTGTYHLATNGNVYFVPTNWFVDPITTASATSAPTYETAIFGTSGNDAAILGDGNADVIYGGANAGQTANGRDTIHAGAGNDTVYGGDGNDRIEGGGGSDTIYGGTDNGNDVIYGDNATNPTATQESLNWSAQGANEANIAAGFTQASGGMNIKVGFTNDGNADNFRVSTDTQYRANGETFASNSAVELRGTGQGPTSTTTIAFDAAAGSGLSDTVTNVTFRINDVDIAGWQDIVTVRAYDAQGNPVTVTLVAAGNDIVSGQTVSGAGGTNDTQASYQGSVLVTIAGPVHAIEIIYSNGGSAGQALWITDVHFTTMVPADGDDLIDAGGGNDLIYGGGGNDSVLAGTGNDTVYGGTGNDTLAGEDGDDTIFGEAGNDSLSGGAGNDSIDGGAGADLINGDAGNDRLAGGDGADTIHGGADDDTIAGDAGDDRLHGGTGQDSIAGGAGNDSLYGDDGNDTLDGGADNDSLYGGAGNDILLGGTGNDMLDGGTGNDSLLGGSGNDILLGDAGNDTLAGGDGADTINGGADDDTITGDAGDDLLYGGTGQDSIAGGTGNDSLYGDDGNDVLDGGADNDSLYGGTGNDILLGGAGNDMLAGGDGADTLTGGAGNDAMAGDGGDDRFVLQSGFGTDTVTGGETGETLGDVLDASGIATGVTLDLSAGGAGDPESGILASGADTVSFAEIETVILGAGDDSVTGSAGNDNVFLGAGADRINAGAGNDNIDLGAADGATDTVVFGAGSGADRIGGFEAPTANGDGTYTGRDLFDVAGLVDFAGVQVNVFDVVVTDDGFGNALLSFPAGEQVVLVGVSPAAVSNPLALAAMGIPMPDFTVEGTAGDDVIDIYYTGDPEGDVVDGSDAADGSNDDLILAGAGNDLVNGGAGNDTIHGGTGNDSLIGEDGDDTLYGEDGDDFLNGVSGNDTLYGGAGNDRIESGTGNDLVHGGDGDDSLNGDIGNDTVFGGAGNDYVRGSFGNDTVHGGEGDDYVWGGYGDDIHIVEDNFGNDTYYGDSEQEVYGDTLDLSAVTADLTIDLTHAIPERGSFTDGTSTATFDEMEHIRLGAGTDTLVLADFGGADRVLEFEAPTANGDGTFTGHDLLDVSGLTRDFGTTPVNVNDVTVTTDGNGDAVLTFPGGESLTLVGVTAAQIASPLALHAMGIPLSDGTVSGTAGADVIDTGYLGDPDGDRVDDNDAHLAGDTGHDDLIEAGGGDDTVHAGAGNDEVHGGTGNDLIDGGAGNDTLLGEAGDDTFILTDGFGTDTITGGETGETSGDVLDGSGLVQGVTVTMSGAETGAIGNGTDSASFTEIEAISTGAGNDTFLGDVGNDVVQTGAGNDILFGGAGNDVLAGGDGDDSLTGGTGADVMDGGDGNDVITFAEADYAAGGDGDDVFILQDLGEATNGTITIVGGEGGETGGDTLRLGTLADMSTLVYGGGNNESGSITLDDGTILNFSEIENIICFTPGTRIATPRGARPVEDLAPGDLVVTRDHGLQPIRWIGQRTVPAAGRLAPVRIRPGVLAGLETDLIVSPQHRMLFQGYRAELLFGESEVLVAAKHLIDGRVVTRDVGGAVTYLHILFDDHEIIYAEGAATESFHPGEVGLTALTAAARNELFVIFPELRSMPNCHGHTARRCLRQHEAQLIRV